MHWNREQPDSWFWKDDFNNVHIFTYVQKSVKKTHFEPVLLLFKCMSVIVGKLVAYDTDGDGDFDVEDAKVLLGKFESLTNN